MKGLPQPDQSIHNFLRNFTSPILILFKSIIVYKNNSFDEILVTNKEIIGLPITNILDNTSENGINDEQFRNILTGTYKNLVPKILWFKSELIKEQYKSFTYFKFNQNDVEFNILSFVKTGNTESLLLENKVLKEQNLLKTAFVANLSHEIRTPLNSIIGFSELLLEEDNTEEEKELYSKLISNSGRSLLQLIEDIIDISKIESGQLNITKARFELNSFLDEILLNFKQEKDVRELFNLNIELEKAFPDKHIYIKTDQIRLQQVLNNLINNAMKFTDSGFIKFGYVFVYENELQFFVKDSGTGIDQKASETIFDRYSQDKTTLKRNTKGSGLGLSISKSIINLLGGEIWLDTKSGIGTTFYFTIPINSTNETSSEIDYLNNFSIPDYSGTTFLIVDDVDKNIVLFKSLLKPTNANIIIAKSGLEALDAVKNNHNISIVLMDIMMPSLDGYDTTRQIKSLRPDIKVIMQTAFFASESSRKSFEAGADEFIAKPINIVELFRKVNTCLGL